MRNIFKRSILICLLLSTAGVTFFSFIAERQSKEPGASIMEAKTRLLLKLKKSKNQEGRLNKEIAELEKVTTIQGLELGRLEKILGEKETELQKKISWWVRVDRTWLKKAIDREKELRKKASKELSEERKNNRFIKEELRIAKADLNKKEEDFKKLGKAHKELQTKNATFEEFLQAKEDQERLLSEVLGEEKAKFRKLKKEKEDLLAQTSALKEENEELKNSLLESARKESSLYEKILALEDTAKKLSSGKELLQSDYNVLQKEYEKLEKRIVRTTEDKIKIEGEMEKAVTKAPILHNNIEKLKAELDGINKAKKELEQKYKEVLAKNKVLMKGTPAGNSLEIAAVKNTEARILKERKNQKLMNGKIQASNNIHNFYIINLGVEDGVSAGDIYYILRGNKRIAEIEVSKVRGKSSFVSAYFVEDGEKIMVGDEVR